MPTTRQALFRLLALGLLVMTGCTAGATSETPTEALPPAFDDGVPGPTGEVLLTVDTGSGTADWDRAALALLEQHDLRITEPFLDEEHVYTGPLWADVLRASGIDLAATETIEVTALDDFVVDIPTDPATLDGLLLAHQEDGEPIDVAGGGPIRLVFPPGNPTGENLNNWIWSVRRAAMP